MTATRSTVTLALAFREAGVPLDRAALPPHAFFTQNAVKGLSSGSSVRLLSPVGKRVRESRCLCA